MTAEVKPASDLSKYDAFIHLDLTSQNEFEKTGTGIYISSDACVVRT